MADRAHDLASLAAIYETGTPDDLKAFVQHCGPDRFANLHEGIWNGGTLVQDFVRPDAPARRLDLDMLRVCLAFGADLAPVVPDMMKGAVSHDAPKANAFLRDEMGAEDRYADYFGPRWLIMHCKSQMARLIAPDIQESLADCLSRSLSTDALPQDCPGTYPLKAFAIILCCDQDVRYAFKAKPNARAWRIDPEIHRRIEATASNHGRIWLRGLEPSFEAVLARDPQAEFFGLTERDFHRGFQLGV